MRGRFLVQSLPIRIKIILNHYQGWDLQAFLDPEDPKPEY